jgi:hypothetical protein
LRYSSSVVAPMQCSSPRASAGLSMLPASIAPSALPAPTIGVQLVDETGSGRRLLDLGEDGLQPLLELAAVLRAGDQRAHVEREDGPLVLQALGHVARTMRCASPSTMAVLPTPGSPMRTGLFLVRRAEDLRIDAPDLLVAAR